MLRSKGRFLRQKVSGESGPGSRDPAAIPAGSRLYFGCMNALRILSEKINHSGNHSD
jgi:hypothetical protein